jgi:hypothetical protein
MTPELTDEAIKQVFETLGIASEEQRERLAPLPVPIESPEESSPQFELFLAHTTEPLEQAESVDA